jgi:hypothetical protein
MTGESEMEDADAISFELSDEQARALRTLAGKRAVRISGRVRGSHVDVDFVACNSPFLACNAPFVSRFEEYDELQG